MGKQGPCCHCGITTTPLWRNGPPEKPVLCNACGSRWRTKGTLVNYIPTHATQLPKDLTNSDELEFKPSKPIVRFKNLNPSYNNNNEEKNMKKTKKEDSFGTFRKVLEDSTAASTSSVSCSDSKTDLTGTVQSEMWVSLVPSKKRTYVSRPTKPSHVEQLTQDLHSLLHQEKINNNNNNNSSKILDDYNDDLVYKKRDTLDEFGYGSVLIRTDNIVESEKLQGLKGRDSPLASVKLQDFINYESFVKNMNLAEQENLFKYLPSIDTNNPPDSLSRMFSSKPFMDELSHFKMLLREGVFALSISGANGEDCKILNSLVLDNLTRSEWVEFHQQIKDKMASGSSSDISNKRPRDISNYTELKGEKRSPKRVRKTPEENNHQLFFKKKGGSCLIAVPLQYSQEDYSEHDLLMDVPHNAPSPEAELLYNGPLKVKSLENSSLVLVDSEIIGEKY